MSRDDDWEWSTEGDLDPDLTEEAGYAYWDPPRRRWLTPTALRVAAAVVLLLFAGTLLLATVR